MIGLILNLNIFNVSIVLINVKKILYLKRDFFNSKKRNLEKVTSLIILSLKKNNL